MISPNDFPQPSGMFPQPFVRNARTGTSSQSIAVPLGPVQVKRGNDVTLWCKLENHSKNGVPVHWQTPPNFRTRTSNCDSFVKEKYVVSCLERWYNMTIVNVQWDDKGKYRCVHTGHIGIVDLQVLVPLTDVSLTYLSSPGEHQNTEFIFKCSTNCAYPAPTVTWFENDPTFLVKSEEHKCTDDKDGLKQTISTVAINVEQKKKLSKISCSAKDSFGVKKTSKAIDELTGSSQGIRVLPGPVEVKQRNNVTLWCELKNNAESKAPVYWHLPNFQTITTNCVSYMEKKYHISCAENGLRWYNLTIVDVQWKDKGIYRCISANGKTVDLRVLVPVTRVSLTHVPTSKKELLFLDKDNDAVLTCTTNCAYPAPSISWFENNKPFNDSPKVIITKSGCTGKKKGQKRTISTITVLGKYVGEERKQSAISCTAGNIKAEPKVTGMVNIRYNAMMTGVYTQNSVTIQPGPVKVTQGKSVRLWCKVKHHTYGVPVHWQSPPKFRTRTGDCKAYEKQKFEMSCAPFTWYNLTIKDVEWKDRGKYRCIHGKSMELVDLQVLVPVTIVSLTHDLRNTTKPLKKDMKAVFTFSTNCASLTPNITWFENGQPFNDSLRVNKSESGCTGDEKGLGQTISMVTVTGKKVVKKKKNSTISCVAKNAVTEQGVSLAINITYEILKPPQPVMGIADIVTIASVPAVVLVVMIAVTVRVIVINVRRYRKKEKAVSGYSEEGYPLIPAKKRGCSVIYEYDDTLATHEEGVVLLWVLRDAIPKHGFGVELRAVKQFGDRPVSDVLEEIGQASKSKKVIISFLEDHKNKRKLALLKDKFYENQLYKTFKEIMQEGEQSFVAVIIQTEEFAPELQWIEKRWNEKKRQTQWVGSAKCHLQFLLDITDETTKQVDVALMSLGTGLAWSYYLGYLMYLLSVFKKTHLTSPSQNQYRDIPGHRIAKRIYIVFTTNCQQPKIMNSERIKQKLEIPEVIYRAGVKRGYYLSIQEVKSKDEKESYYGVVCFLTAVQCLLEMKDDPNKEFVRFDEDDMRTHGKDCFEKLKLVIKYNEKIKKDESKFEFIEFNTETANADENDLADDLFNRMKEACSSETISPTEEARSTDSHQIGVLSGPISEDIKEFVDNLENSIIITNFPHVDDRSEFGLNIIRESKRIFMVLTDDLVKSDAFAKWFYMILDRGFEINDKRFLVCLNCLNENADHPKVLELEQLFSCVGYIKGWADKVKKELEGDVEEIRHEQLFHNIGTGLAMSWYYNFLRIKIPKVRDVIDQCPFLKDKFEEGRMSHKVFFLFPTSCFCPEKVHCGNIIKEVHGKDIKLPHIMKDNRDYTPRVYSLKDEGKEYYAFVEYIASADTMFGMMKCTDTVHPQMQWNIIQEERNRFYTKLLTLINHKDEPMDINNRISFIQYDDRELKDQQLECMLLDHVKEQIQQMVERVLPRPIDNGATIEFPHS